MGPLEGDWTQTPVNISALHTEQLHGERTTRLDGSTNSSSKNSRDGGEMSKGGVEAMYDVPACIRDPGEMWCRPFPWIQVAWIPPYISLTLPYIMIKCPTFESLTRIVD